MSEDTKKRILRTAEKLFAARGVQGTSLRLISRQARVNLAAINYHFGSKENLARTVVGRLIQPLDLERERLLDAARAGTGRRAAGQGAGVGEIVRAFLLPWVAFRRKHPQYVRIIARMYSGRDRAELPLRDVLQEASRDAYNRFTRAVAEALPGIPHEVLLRRVNLAVAAAASFLLLPWLIEGLEELSGTSLDETVLVDHVVGLIESGPDGAGPEV